MTNMYSSGFPWRTRGKVRWTWITLGFFKGCSNAPTKCIEAKGIISGSIFLYGVVPLSEALLLPVIAFSGVGFSCQYGLVSYRWKESPNKQIVIVFLSTCEIFFRYGVSRKPDYSVDSKLERVILDQSWVVKYMFTWCACFCICSKLEKLTFSYDEESK